MESKMSDAGKTGAELVQDFLGTNDVTYVFGCPGTTETTSLAALADSATRWRRRPRRS
jgi:thiamine pyrophosphate-dependent acetolactate synthase large subunit-like protein